MSHMDKEYIRETCKMIAGRLPDGYGFVLLAAPFGEGKHRLQYASNIDRPDAIKLTKEWLFHIGEQENWMKHIK